MEGCRWKDADGRPKQRQGYGRPKQEGQGYGRPKQGQGYGRPKQGQGYDRPKQGQGYGRLKQGQGYGRPMQEGQGNGTAEENTEKVKFVDEYGLWLGANSAIVHIVRSGIT